MKKFYLYLLIILILVTSVFAINSNLKKLNHSKIQNPESLESNDINVILRLDKDISLEKGHSKNKILKSNSIDMSNVSFKNNKFIITKISKERLQGLEDNANIKLIRIDTNRFKIFLDISVPSINASVFWNLDLNGSGVNVAVIDTGMQTNHSALNVTLNGTTRIFESYNSVDLGDSNDTVGHGTHVVGIIISSNSTYTGVAPGVDTIINIKALNATGGTDNSVMNGLSWALINATNFPKVLSNSWGASYKDSSNGCIIALDTLPDGNDILTTFVDNLVDTYNVTIVFAAGNDGTCGNISLGVPADSFNVISVGSINDGNTIDRTNDVISSFSSLGPTLDGRKKPDLVAPGSNIISTYLNNDFASESGTSMATPHVSGAVALLSQLGLTNLEIKSLLINTAEDRGTSGWDNIYGWGYIELGNAYNKSNFTLESTIENNSYKLYKIDDVSVSDKFTLVWNRHIIGNDILNNLDLYLYNESNGNLINNSSSSLDNVEQVISDNDYSSVVLVLNTSDFNNNLTTETLGLSGYKNLTESNLDLNITINSSSSSLLYNETLNVTINITNNGSLNLHNITLFINSNFTSDNITIDYLGPGDTNISDLVVTPKYLGNKTLYFDSSFNNYGKDLSFTSSLLEINITNVNISITNQTPDLTFSIDEGDSQLFSVDVNVPDGSLNYTWELDVINVANTSTYTYSPDFNSAGLHNLTVNVTDGFTSANLTWDIIVNNVAQVVRSGGGGSSSTPKINQTLNITNVTIVKPIPKPIEKPKPAENKTRIIKPLENVTIESEVKESPGIFSGIFSFIRIVLKSLFGWLF